MNGSVTLSGAGAPDDTDGSAESARISDIPGSGPDNTGARASTDDLPEGTGSGGAFDGAGGIGGATSIGSGAAGAGGKRDDSSSKGESAGTANAGAAEGGTSNDEPVNPPELWFSEYVEGSSSNKALEIAARTRSVLDGCKVSSYFNGKTEATVVASLSGMLEAGQVLTLCSSSLKEQLAETCNQVGNLIFNGDDAVILSCNGAILDVIGQIGVDPGLAWGSDSSGTADHTLRRKCTIPSGDPVATDAFDPNAEWQTFPVDTFDGLGSLGC